MVRVVCLPAGLEDSLQYSQIESQVLEDAWLEVCEESPAKKSKPKKERQERRRLQPKKQIQIHVPKVVLLGETLLG